MTEIHVARHGSYGHASSISFNAGVTEKSSRKLPQFEQYVRLLPYLLSSLRDLKDAFQQLLLALSDREFLPFTTFECNSVIVAPTTERLVRAAARFQNFSLLIVANTAIRKLLSA